MEVVKEAYKVFQEPKLGFNYSRKSFYSLLSLLKILPKLLVYSLRLTIAKLKPRLKKKGVK